MFSKIEPFLLKKEFFPSGKDFFLRLTPVLGITLLEVAGGVLSSLLILYSRELLLYSIFYPETRYSTRILLKSIEKF